MNPAARPPVIRPVVLRILPIGARLDARGQLRFDLRLAARYRTLTGFRQGGDTETLNIGSTGVAFRTVDVLKAPSRIKLWVDWPVLLEGVRPIRLALEGRVVRSDAEVTAMTVERYDFLTRAPDPAPKVMTAGHAYA